jgi:hypothetical protein
MRASPAAVEYVKGRGSVKPRETLRQAITALNPHRMAMQQIVQPFTQHSYQKFVKHLFEFVSLRYRTDIPSGPFFIFCFRLSPALQSYKRTGHGITRRPYRSKTLTHFGTTGWRIQGTFISPYQLRSVGIGRQGIMLSRIRICMKTYFSQANPERCAQGSHSEGAE